MKTKRKILVELPDGVAHDEMLQHILVGIQRLKHSHKGDDCEGVLSVELRDIEFDNLRKMSEFNYCGAIRKPGGKITYTECMFKF